MMGDWGVPPMGLGFVDLVCLFVSGRVVGKTASLWMWSLPVEV